MIIDNQAFQPVLSGIKSICSICDDTDWFVLLLQFFWQIEVESYNQTTSDERIVVDIASSASDCQNIYICFFYTTNDLHKNNTKTKSKLNKRTTEFYLIYGDQIGETRKVKIKILPAHVLSNFDTVVPFFGLRKTTIIKKLLGEKDFWLIDSQ